MSCSHVWLCMCLMVSNHYTSHAHVEVKTSAECHDEYDEGIYYYFVSESKHNNMYSTV